MMIKYYDLSEAVDFYTYSEANRRFYKFSSTPSPDTITNNNQSSIIDINDPTITIGGKEWLTNRTKVGGEAEFLFSKYAEKEGWKYEQISNQDDSEGYDFEVYETTNPIYYEVKRLNKDNRFFLTPKERQVCSEKKEKYKLFLVKKKANLYSGYILENPYFFFKLNELENKSILSNYKNYTLYVSTIEIVLEEAVLKVLKNVHYNVQHSFKVKYKSASKF